VKLSVMLKAYNHEPFIAQALDSALAQRTSFPFEVVVGEDCSTDLTRAIVDRYASRHPDRIKVLHRPTRVGMVRNTMELYRASSAEYAAWLDGDDYWTSPDKLQRQVEWLDARPRHTMCFHEADRVGADAVASHWSLGVPGKADYTIEDVLVRPPGYTSTCVYRRVLRRFPEWFERLPFCDWPLQVLHAAEGPAGLLPEIMSVYRERDAAAAALGFDRGGALSRAAFWAPRHAEIYEVLNRHFGYRYDAIIRLELARLGADGQALRRLAAERSLLTRHAWAQLKKWPWAARTAVAVGGRLARALPRARRAHPGGADTGTGTSS
jgi:glycosyltransferase involved in cell wall biosynthesis